jgi:hypothetical protein
MNNYYALFQFSATKSVAVRYISDTCRKNDIEDAMISYIYTNGLDNQEITDCDGFVKTIMDSFNVEYEIVNYH